MAGTSSSGKARFKPFSEALLMMGNRDEGDIPERGLTNIQRAAAQLTQKAIDGDIAAVKEFADRLEGKVPQGIVGGDEGEAPVKIINTIRLIGPDD